MKVSIVMCAYNMEAYMDAAIKSIINQTYQNWELIISNDASTDGTRQIVSGYLSDPRIRLFNHQNNLGYLRNKNWAFQQVTGDLLTQLDADDVCSPDRIQMQVSVFANNPEIMICGTNFVKIDDSGKVINDAEDHKRDFIIDEMQLQYPFWFPGLMFHKEVFSEIGPFSEYFLKMPGDDHHWTFRANQKYPILYLNKVLYYYRVHSSSFTKKIDPANPLKMFVDEIIQELFRQRRETGTDWIEMGAFEKMKPFEQTLIGNQKLMGEKYRMWAAMAIDHMDWTQSSFFLKESWRHSKFKKKWFRTLAYYLRSRWLA